MHSWFMKNRLYSSYILFILYIIKESEVFAMTVDTNTMISITEANQNFSKVTKLVDEHGTAVILKIIHRDILSLILVKQKGKELLLQKM